MSATGSASRSLTKYDVHLFVVVRLKVPEVEATSHRDAVQKAIDRAPDLYQRFESPDGDFAEEFSHFLVDQGGDAEYDQSQWFFSQQEPLLANLKRLVAWHDADHDGAELDQIVAEAREAVSLAI